MDDKYKLDLRGQKFTNLLVIKYSGKNKDGRTMWLCKCDCGNKTIVSTKLLRNGETKSCGCKLYMKENRMVGEANNKYDLSGECGVGYDHKNNSFLFDLSDYNKIKIFRWIVADGYVKAYSLRIFNKKMIYLHRTILDLNNDEETIVDHVNRIPSDNRRKNLRISTQSQNIINRSISDRNSTGFIGVDWMKNRNKYRARIVNNNGKEIHLGVFDNINDAVCARLIAEKTYYGEFAPQKNLFNEYGIV